MNNRRTRGISGASMFTVVLMIFVILWVTNQFDAREKMVSWQEFETLVEQDNIASVTIDQNKSVPTGCVEILLKNTDEDEIISGICMSLT